MKSKKGGIADNWELSKQLSMNLCERTVRMNKGVGDMILKENRFWKGS